MITNDIIINQLFDRYPILIDIQNEISAAVSCIIEVYNNKGKILVCGNGGSASDADHIVGELMKGFLRKRPLDADIINKLSFDLPMKLQCPLRAINLTQNSALITAIINDLDPHMIFAQQVLGLGDAGDIFWGISTSGNAKDIHYAAIVAKTLGLNLIGLTGQFGGQMVNDEYDILIQVPAIDTMKVQELHLPVYHAICAAVESYFFKD